MQFGCLGLVIYLFYRFEDLVLIQKATDCVEKVQDNHQYSIILQYISIYG